MNEQEKNGITKIASCLQDLRKCIVEKISDKKKGKAICTAIGSADDKFLHCQINRNFVAVQKLVYLHCYN